MRGDLLHNMMGKETKTIFEGFFGQVSLEYPCRRNGTVSYLDIFARENQFVLGVEIETTCRHGIDNALKATAVNIPLWVIVPTGKVKLKLLRKLKPLALRPGGEPIKILLLGQLEQELKSYLSLRTLGNGQTNIASSQNSKGGI